MKNFLTTAVAAVCVGACALASSAPVRFACAEESERPINLFSAKGDWDFTSDVKNTIAFDGRTMEFTPVGLGGSTFCANKIGEGKISFTYRLEYAEASIMESIFDPEDHTYPFFFGILFANNPPTVVNPTASQLAIPFSALGGYPYMVAFDTEVQGGEPNRVKQLGLTLRRYKAGGSHDYTRWSSIAPTEETFINTSGVKYESKIPAYYKPVGVEDCFDENTHTVDTEMKYLYKANGDEYDAVKIDVSFDGELCLSVIDEMPFVGEDYGDEIDVDKRGTDGWLSFYVYNGFNGKDAEFWDYKIYLTSFSAVYAESSAPKPDTSADDTSSGGTGGGCGSMLGGLSGFGVLMCAAFTGIRKRKNLPIEIKKK